MSASAWHVTRVLLTTKATSGTKQNSIEAIIITSRTSAAERWQKWLDWLILRRWQQSTDGRLWWLAVVTLGVECGQSDGGVDNMLGIPLSLFIAMSSLATLGLIYSAAFIVFNIIYRNDRYTRSAFCTASFTYTNFTAIQNARNYCISLHFVIALYSHTLTVLFIRFSVVT